MVVPVSGPSAPHDTITQTASPKLHTSHHLQQSSISSFIPRSRKVNHNALHKKKIDSQLMKLFTLDFQPFSIVEDKGFISYSNALDPSYQIPNRKTLSTSMLPAMYEHTLNVVQNKLKNVSSVCLTTDCWTSAINESYIAITAHYITDEFYLDSALLGCCGFDTPHTSVNLAHEIKRVVDEWGLSNKVLIVVSDNAANITGAIVNELGWKHFGCYAHSLNLIVQNALSIVKETRDKVKTIVSHFKRSTAASEKLLTYQKNSGVAQPKRLLQEVPTRWNSTFYMLQRITLLQEAVRSSLALIDRDLPILSSEEWDVCTQLCRVLKPFEEVTRKLSAEKYATASQVIVLTRGLLAVCSKMQEENFLPITKQIVAELQRGILTRMSNFEESKTISLCTFLDPRFKMVAFSNKRIAENVKKRVFELVSAEISKGTQESVCQRYAEPVMPEQTEELSVWEEFDKVVASLQPSGTATSRSIIEVQRYLEDPMLPRNQDPLKWWSENQHLFPIMAKLVKRHFNVLATSVPCERIFSKAGNLINDRRTRLTSGKVKQLMFLNVNSSDVSP